MKDDPVPTIDDPPQEERDDDEPDLLDASPMEKIYRLTEGHMLAGWSQLRCYQFVIQFGISREVFDRMWHDIKVSWKMPTMTFENFCEQRDLARARYLKVFNLAIKRNQLNTAAAVIEKMVRLDGLDEPAKLNIQLGQNSQITNSARDQVNQLMERMKLLAKPIDDGMGPIIEVEADKEEPDSLKPKVVSSKGRLTGPILPNGEIEGRYLPGDPRSKNGSNGKAKG